MTIIVKPVDRKHETLKLVNPGQRKSIVQAASGKMPNIYMAMAEEGMESFDADKMAAVGFRYRRASHHAEIWWWYGEDPTLLDRAIKACMFQAILEGRKRLECFNEVRTKFVTQFSRGGEMFDHALDAAGFRYEGFHPYWTKEMEDVNIWGWNWLTEGLPEISEDTHFYLGDNETTRHYREKNIDLFKKDRDYYNRVEDGQGLSFAEHIQRAEDYVRDSDHVTVLEDWSSK